MQYDLYAVWDEQRGEERLTIYGPEDGEGALGARLGSVDAETWLHAKQALGFELTPLQARLVDLNPEERAAVILGERWAGMGALLVRQPGISYPKGWISAPVPAAAPRNEGQRMWNGRRGL